MLGWLNIYGGLTIIMMYILLVVFFLLFEFLSDEMPIQPNINAIGRFLMPLVVAAIVSIGTMLLLLGIEYLRMECIIRSINSKLQ